MEKSLLVFGQIFSLSSVKTENIIFKIFGIQQSGKKAGKICQSSHSNGFFRFAYYVTS